MGLGVFVPLVEIPGGGVEWGSHQFPAKMENPARWGVGVLREIPSAVEVWIFSGTTQCIFILPSE